MNTLGRHLLIEFRGCDPDILDDKHGLQTLMERAARAAHATVVNSVFHTFSPQGVTGVVVVEESHFSVHTWPEYGYVAVDVYTCGDCDPEAARAVLVDGLGAERCEWMLIERGTGRPGGDMQIVDHSREAATLEDRRLAAAR